MNPALEEEMIFDWAILFISIFHTDFANAKIFNFDEEKLSFFIT